MRAAVAVVATIATTTAGCGDTQPPPGASSPRTVHPSAPTTSTATTPPPLSAAERDARDAARHRRMLRRHDLPPKGVRQQIDYYSEGDPPGCLPEPSKQHPITFGRGFLHELRPSDRTSHASALPERGEDFAICIGGMVDGRRVLITMRGPTGSVRRTRLPMPGALWYTSFARRAPLGRYVVDARQGRLLVRRTFTLGKPSQPEYHVTERRAHGHIFDVVLLGLQPHEQAELLFYRALPYQRELGTPQAAAYVTSTSLRAAADGFAIYPIDVGSIGVHCSGYLVKARIRGRLLDDRRNTLSSFPVCARR